MYKKKTANQVSVIPKPAATSMVRSPLPGARTALRASQKALRVEVTTASPPLLILLRELRSKEPFSWEALAERSLASFEMRKLGANVIDTFYKRYDKRISGLRVKSREWKVLHNRRSSGGRPLGRTRWLQHRRGPGCSRA